MTDDHSADEPRPTAQDDALTRRRLLAVSGGVGTALLAGCSSQSTSDSGQADGNSVETADDQTTDTSASVGSFRLLISDQPVAIDEFDSLDVSFDRARVFRNDVETETASAANESSTTNGTEMESTETEMTTANETETESTNETATATEMATEMTAEAAEEDDADESDGEDSGFTVIDLEGATVDLTEVLGKKASEVFDGELPEGRYTKVELYAADVGGVVDGEDVEVKIPSGKLQITTTFEVRAGETVSFVFDINVVKRGKNGYNLLPVISESGVAGEDVEVEEVERTKTPTTQPSSANATNTANGSAPTNTTEMSGSENGGADNANDGNGS